MSVSGNVDEVAHSHESALVKDGTLNAVFAEYPCKFFGSGGDSAFVLAPDGVPQNYVRVSPFFSCSRSVTRPGSTKALQQLF